MTLFHHLHWRHYVKYGCIAAAFYCTTVTLFCRDANFTDTWLLFAGNLLFLVIISISLFSFNRQRRSNASTVSMLAAGNITTITGIIISCIASIIILAIYVPVLFHTGTTTNVLANKPANTIGGKTKGMVFMIFMDALIGNFVSGFAASIIFSFTLKRNQEGEKESAELTDL
jgi:hypothetical protein